jgi:hypothetical protein
MMLCRRLDNPFILWYLCHRMEPLQNPQHAMFAQALPAVGFNATAAYRIAYPNTTDGSAAAGASRLLNGDYGIREAVISALSADPRLNPVHVALSLTEQLEAEKPTAVKTEDGKIVFEGYADHPTRLETKKLLLKVAGALGPSVTLNDQRSVHLGADTQSAETMAILAERLIRACESLEQGMAKVQEEHEELSRAGGQLS